MPEQPEALTDPTVRRLRRQAAWCHQLGSPFYSALLERAADDLESGGAAVGVLGEFRDEPGSTALALRFMGAVHRLVLDESLPELAARYPSTGGDGDAEAAWPAFRNALVERAAELRTIVRRGCQTNEVGRSAALLGGFLEAAHRTRRELRILELGASAGLNLLWDRFRYESPRGAWGDAASPVRFRHAFEVPPPLNRPATVVERRGCDLNPIDPTTEEGALTLRSFVWPDQLGRLAQLDGAIEIARAEPGHVERIGAAEFLERELARPCPGVTTVVYHSVFLQYVDQASRERIAAALAAAREADPGSSPVHHLAMEPGEETWEIRLDGELLGTSGAHGTAVRWVAPPESR